MNQTVLVLDFGGQYKELIARSIRNCNVYSMIRSGKISAEEVSSISPIGIVLTGGPNSVYKENAIGIDKRIFELGIPVLGICYGMQLLCHTLGGRVEGAKKSEYGVTETVLDVKNPLFLGLKQKIKTLMSHTDTVVGLPDGFISTGSTPNTEFAACANVKKKLFGIQFHPEVELTENGAELFHNFLYNICGAAGDYNIDDYVERQIAAIRKTVGSERMILALSGGVDSSVAAAILSRAIGKQLTCVFVDHGCMRYGEGDDIERVFSAMDLRFIRVNAEERFLSKLKGVSEPEEKRKIIGKEFISVFQDEADKLGDIKFLAQGTIYPDVIESGGEHAETIKSHHNVGGLPKDMKFTVIEPLRLLFKDEVRAIGAKLGLKKFLVSRQPFPGPGLAIRIMGDVTKQKLDMLRLADRIVCQEIGKIAKRMKVSQYFAVYTDVKTVGVMGDGRSYDNLIAVRAVTTSDFMTCDYTPIPHTVLKKISARIVNEVKGVNRVVYDITSKPPATVEWE
ncbi:MAG: glutamine-hydrolyzing GMP synthase [Clostridiales bacterium]|jgi:GMP synthase (glutamine-hydrolysing)|nr:glutamine-hydrolyzing GMP synthase [Clostridiales bacterium]